MYSQTQHPPPPYSTFIYQQDCDVLGAGGVLLREWISSLDVELGSLVSDARPCRNLQRSEYPMVLFLVFIKLL